MFTIDQFHFKIHVEGVMQLDVTERTRLVWCNTENVECCHLEDARQVYQSYLRIAMMYGSEVRCLRETKMAILR